MTTTVKKAVARKRPTEWQEVGQRFEALGTDLRRHFAKVGQDAATQRDALEKSVEALVKDIEKMFLAAGQTLRDPVLRKDVAKIGEAVRHAVHETVRAGDKPRADHAHGQKAGTKPAAKPVHKPATAKAKHPV